MAFADDYNDVASRIRLFRDKHPDGSLQPVIPEKPYEVATIGDQTFIIYYAAAYRTADDARPGIGVAWEQFPGRTNFTRGSELQNAETSAWGRAIVAVLAADAKHVASTDDVQKADASRPASKARIEATKAEAADANIGDWVKDQQFPWPWTEDVCKTIEDKARSTMSEPF